MGKTLQYVNENFPEKNWIDFKKTMLSVEQGLLKKLIFN